MSHIEFQHYPIDVDGIPKTWCVTSIAALGADVQSGFPTGSHNREGRGIPHIRPMNIDRNGNIDLNDVKFVSSATSVLRLQEGDVLFNNTNSPELIGKTSAITHCDEWGFSNHMTRLRFPRESLEYHFAAYQLHFLWIARYFRHRCVNHVNQASISAKPLAQTVPFLVAPLNEQRRIVAKIEELFSDLEAGVAALERAKANLKRYRAAVLKAAVEGKLTEEWRAKHPAEETASALLERILKERRQKWEVDQLAKFAAAGKQPPKNWRDKYVEPSPPVTTGLPELPDGWCWCTASQICDMVASGSTPSADRMQEDQGDVPFLKVYNLTFTGVLDFSKNPTFIDAETHLKQSRSIVLPGDVLINIVGPPLGKVSIVPDEFREWNINQAIVVFRPTNPILNRYLAAALMTDSVMARVTSLAKATAGQFNIGVSMCRDLLPLPLAPVVEQQQIVSQVAERLSQIDSAEMRVEHAFLRAARLRQSILKQAFEGKLVPQDPQDEPASVLLERLQASRLVHEGNGKVGPPKRTRGRRAQSKQLEGRAD